MSRRAQSAGTHRSAHPPWTRWAWLLPVLVAAIAYAPAPWSDLVWDDKLVVAQQLPAFVTWHDALFPPAGIEQWSVAYYRPLVVLSYMLDRWLFGEGAVGLHLSNVLLHLAATALLFQLLRRLLGQRPGAVGGALAGAGLFAAHPVHTESVNWISGRSDVIAMLAVLTSVLCALRWRDRRSVPYLAATAAALLAALLSKEVAIAGLAIIPATLLIAPAAEASPASARTRQSPMWAGLIIAMAVATAGAMALRISAGVSVPQPGGANGLEQLALAARVLTFLAAKCVWPWPQSHFIPSGSLPGPAAASVTCAALVALVAATALRWQRRGDGVPLLAMVWFLAAAAPVLAAAVLQVAEAPAAERYAYLPSVAVALLAAVLIAAGLERGWRAASAGIAALVIAVCMVATAQRGLVWQDDESLWRDAVAKAPDEALPLNELAVSLQGRGDWEAALDLWLQARPLARDPRIAGIVDGNLGLAYLQAGDLRQARRFLESAMQENPQQHNAQRGLGAVLFTEAAALGLTPETAPQVRVLLEASRSHYEAALRLNPQSIPARLELALVLARLGDLTGRFGGSTPPRTLYAAALRELEWVFARRPAAAEVVATRTLAERLRSALAQTAE